MKLHEEFEVAEPAAAIWTFFEQPELVARCMPGVESVNVLDADNVTVRATQSIGPMSATFEAKVTVLERVPGESIRFQAVGRSVRGAIGHVRATNEVHLRGSAGGTTIAVDGDVVLAGALGSVGQKIVARQASKVTAEFADNLRVALTGGPPPEHAAAGQAGTAGHADTAGQQGAAGRAGAALAARRPFAHGAGAGAGQPGAPHRPDPWSRAAAGLSAASVVLSLIALLRSLRGDRAAQRTRAPQRHRSPQRHHAPYRQRGRR